jgi:hypothetical protein
VPTECKTAAGTIERKGILSDDDDVTEGDETAAPKTRKQRGLDSMAMRELRRAHKLFNDGGPSAAEANFLVASASVLATLDLASAIRESKGVADD